MKLDKQILVRIEEGYKEFVAELAEDEGITSPQWVRLAIIERIARICDLEIPQ